jgi:HlyD family secretion protein
MLITLLVAGAVPVAAQQSSDNALLELERVINATIREPGTVVSRTAVPVHSELDSTIVEIVPEGTTVKKGDTIIQLDRSALDEELQAHQVLVAQQVAQRDAVQLQQARLQQEHDTRKKLDELSLSAVEKEREHALGDTGQLALEIKEAQAQLEVANARLGAAQDILVAAKVTKLSRAEVATAIAAKSESESAITVAKARLAYLDGPRRDLLEMNARLAAEQRRFEARVVDSEYQERLAAVAAELAVLEKEAALARARLERTDNRLDACKIQAPADGIVTYISAGSRRPSIDAGSQVRNGQPLVRIVDPQKYMVRALVNETRIAKVRVGQPAVVKVDAFPNMEIPGEVESISATPEPTTFFSDVKNYAVTVTLQEQPVPLRLGLSALVEIQVEEE